jgi:hypothetical protein
MSLTLVTSCITGVIDTELILYQAGRWRGDWGGAREGLAVMSWKGERGLGLRAGGVGGHCELERGEGAGVACWRGWQTL